eukprot:TRINITY_DN30523_c0_g1_i1.p1 TRINITY_DN30523_c0_g1~~TRINITY_DN30523_c0_g1_i1.p1  ORF type:complete len:568 (-),score=67.03 TRINITY_DN30523_c0_g1_i1:487-2190(-)
MFVVVIWINHVVACGWFAMTQYLDSDTGASWLDSRLDSDPTMTYGDIGTPFQYTTSLHWALSQMTPGSMQVAPVNTVERVYNILVLLFGMFVFSSIVSGISSKMMQYKMNTRTRTTTLAQLRKFMLQNKVRTELAVRIQKQVGANLSEDKKLVMKDLEALRLLNASLRAELQAEVLHQHLCRHRLFVVCAWSDETFSRRLCRDDVMDASWLSRGKPLFLAGAEALGVYHVISGDVLYSRDGLEHEFYCKSWFCDIGIFTQWVHNGSLRAESQCEILTICIARFLESLEHLPVVLELLGEFARTLVHMIASKDGMRGAFDDIALPNDIIDDLYLSVHGDCQVFVGLTCANKVHVSDSAWAFARKTNIRQLRKEILSRSCLMHPDEKLEVHRVVALAAVKIVRDDGLIFIEIGKKDADEAQAKATGTFPGKKARTGEAVDGALQRILDGSLAPMRAFIQIGTSTDSISFSESASLGISTKYIKRTYSAELTAPLSTLQSVQVDTFLGKLDIYPFVHNDGGGEKMSYYTWLHAEEADRILEADIRACPEWNHVLSRVSSQVCFGVNHVRI